MAKNFSGILSSFLLSYLPVTRGYGRNTVSSYRDTFVLFLRFMSDECGRHPETISFEDFSHANVEAFIRWLEEVRGCSVNTCNNRLAALKSFFRYTQSEAPEWLDIASSVFEIKAKKSAQSEISYLSSDAIALLLKVAQSGGIRDLALLSLLYDTGARVQEIADLAIGDIRSEKPNTVKLTGKGRKTRIVPLTAQVATILSKYTASLGAAEQDNMLFRNWRGEPIGRAGIAYVLRSHVQTAHDINPGIMPPKVTPHMLRHSKAMHLLENGVNLIYIRDFLGHQTVITTEIYAKANPEMKRKAIEAGSVNVINESHFSDEEKTDLLSWLREMV